VTSAQNWRARWTSDHARLGDLPIEALLTTKTQNWEAAMHKIVIIEDNPLHARLFKDILEQYGYRVLLAPEGVEGLTLARREQPDLMIIDCYLPGERALQAVQTACTDRLTYRMPIIATSAFADANECGALAAFGCAAYVPKPLCVGSFIATVKTLLSEPAIADQAAA
jgi:two-component system, cell cycle response regulator DivK